MGLKLKRIHVSYYVVLSAVAITIFTFVLLKAVIGNLAFNNASSLSSLLVRELSRQMQDMEHVNNYLSDIQGDDYRIMRWDATDHTASRQNDSGCSNDKFTLATKLIIGQTSEQLRGRAAEYLTFCVTDNPANRAKLSEQDGIHLKLVEMALLSPAEVTVDPDVKTEIQPASFASAMACHLIYISSFNNKRNHELFQKAGAITALASIVKDVHASPIQVMWAAAALQNLAASYCSTDDGRCQWDWMEDDEELVVSDDNKPITSDGSFVRKIILEDTELMDRLIELACRGPLGQSPFPGDDAMVHRDEFSLTIIPWAAAGALKNVAIDSDARNYIHEEHPNSLECFCQLSHSRDWLESNKGEGLLFMLRRSDPCWFQEPRIEYGKQGATRDTIVCVDNIFYDSEGYTCSDYDEDPSEEDCSVKDRYQTSAKDACCACKRDDDDDDNKQGR